MDTIVNYAMMYNAAVGDLITTKLTSFFNKTVLKNKTRVIIFMPMHMETFRADRHKQIFDEIVIVKVNDSDSKFWNTRFLSHFYYFINSTGNLDNWHIYLDFGKIFINLPKIPDGTEIVALSAKNNQELMESVNNKLAIHCDMKKLKPDDLKSYDFSLFYISDDAKSHMQSHLRHIIKTYPDFITSEVAYAILSWLVNAMKKNHYIDILLPDIKPVDISYSPLIEDFYTII